MFSVVCYHRIVPALESFSRTPLFHHWKDFVDSLFCIVEEIWPSLSFPALERFGSVSLANLWRYLVISHFSIIGEVWLSLSVVSLEWSGRISHLHRWRVSIFRSWGGVVETLYSIVSWVPISNRWGSLAESLSFHHWWSFSFFSIVGRVSLFHYMDVWPSLFSYIFFGKGGGGVLSSALFHVG